MAQVKTRLGSIALLMFVSALGGVFLTLSIGFAPFVNIMWNSEDRFSSPPELAKIGKVALVKRSTRIKVSRRAELTTDRSGITLVIKRTGADTNEVSQALQTAREKTVKAIKQAGFEDAVFGEAGLEIKDTGRTDRSAKTVRGELRLLVKFSRVINFTELFSLPSLALITQVKDQHFWFSDPWSAAADLRAEGLEEAKAEAMRRFPDEIVRLSTVRYSYRSRFGVEGPFTNKLVTVDMTADARFDVTPKPE